MSNRFPLWGPVSVAEPKILPGGFSKITILINLEASGIGKRSLVIRAEQPATLVFFDGATIENEYHVLKLVHAAGRRVAEPLWLETDTGPSERNSWFLKERRGEM